MRSPEPLIPPDALRFADDRYVVVSRIGTGRSTVVYRGYDTVSAEWCALKVLRHDVGDSGWSVRDRFVRNGRLLQRVLHPNLVEVHDVLGGRTPVLVMDLATGGTLARWVARHGRMSPGMICGAALEVARGLQALHEFGATHGGVRGSNVLVTAAGVRQLADLEAEDRPLTDDTGRITDLRAVGELIRELSGGGRSGLDALDRIANGCGAEPLESADAIADALELVLVVAPPEPAGTPDLVLDTPFDEEVVQGSTPPTDLRRLVSPRSAATRLPYTMPVRDHEARRTALLAGDDDAPDWVSSEISTDLSAGRLVTSITITAPIVPPADAPEWLEEDTERMSIVDLNPDGGPDPDSVTAQSPRGGARGWFAPLDRSDPGLHGLEEGTQPVAGHDEVMADLVSLPPTELEAFEGTGDSESSNPRRPASRGWSPETTAATANTSDTVNTVNTASTADTANTVRTPDATRLGRGPRTNLAPPVTAERLSPVRGRQGRRRGETTAAYGMVAGAVPEPPTAGGGDGGEWPDPDTSATEGPDRIELSSGDFGPTGAIGDTESWMTHTPTPSAPTLRRSGQPVPQQAQGAGPGPPPIPKELQRAAQITLLNEAPAPTPAAHRTPQPAPVASQTPAAAAAGALSLLVVPTAISLGIVFLVLGVFGAVLGSAALDVNRAESLTSARQRTLYRTLDQEIALVGQISQTPQRRAELEAAFRVYADRSAEPERSDAAFALVDAIDQAVAATESTGELAFRLRQIRSARDDVAEAQDEWQSAADGRLGRWAVALGLARPPP